MREAVLLINFQDKERLTKMKYRLFSMKMRMVQIREEEYLQSIGYLAGMKDMEKSLEKYNGEALGQEMIVFAGLGEGRLNQLLGGMRKSGIRVDYKAILTETNRTWTVPELYKELAAEHESMQKMREGK